VPALIAGGHAVTRLVRARPRDAREFRWDPAAGVMDPAATTSCDAVIHLAGASIAAGRWTASRKAEIMESRRSGTRMIAAAIARGMPKPRILICGSAIGYYGDRGEEVLTEESGPGTGFLAEVARVWEGEASAAAQAGVRVVRLRLGMVLARLGGALPRLAVPFRLGLGGPIGAGRHWMSWIALDDLVRVLDRVLAAGDLEGPLNAVSPGAVTNREFSRTLGRVLGRPAVLPVPRWAIAAVLGEMGRELLLSSQRVAPARLLEHGFRFEHPSLEEALRHLLRTPPIPD
jgi:uncharacterized protein (TIGR01777 family)